MLSVGKALFVAALGFAASELMFKNTMYSPLSQAPANDGNVYQKPNETCNWNGTDLTGCKCAGFVAFYVDHENVLQAVVCSQHCPQDSCPAPPKGEGTCESYGQLTGCMIKCFSNDDCSSEAHCQTFYEGGDNFCMFKP